MEDDLTRQRIKSADLVLNRGQFSTVSIATFTPSNYSPVRCTAATPPPTSSIPSSQHDHPSSSTTSRHQPQVQQPPPNNSDEPEDEPAFINVLPAVTLQLWSSLLERRGYQVSDGEVILSPSKSKPNEEGGNFRNQPPMSPVPPELPVGRSIISSFRRANSFAPAVPEKEAGPSSRQLPFRRAATSAGFGVCEARTKPLTRVVVDAQAGPSTGLGTAVVASPALALPSRIFTGMSFRALGEAKTQTVRSAVEQLGGRMSTDEDEDVTFILVRLCR